MYEANLYIVHYGKIGKKPGKTCKNNQSPHQILLSDYDIFKQYKSLSFVNMKDYSC